MCIENMSKPKQEPNYYCKICKEHFYDTCFMHYRIEGSGELNINGELYD